MSDQASASIVALAEAAATDAIAAGANRHRRELAMSTVTLSGNTVRSQVTPASYAAFRTGAGTGVCAVVGNITNNTSTLYANITGAGVKQAANSWS